MTVKAKLTLRLISMIIISLMLLHVLTSCAEPPSPNFVDMEFNPAFGLIDASGKEVAAADFQDKYMLVFFGFASCPDVCPTGLQKMADAYGQLADKQKQKLAMIFITLDPERDGKAAMRDYTKIFSPAIVGLTGGPEQIKSAADNYKVYFNKVPQKSAPYMIEHTSYTYLIAPGLKPLGLFKYEATADEIAQKLLNML